jgi:hypothetical protein
MQTLYKVARREVLTVTLLRIRVFWDVTLRRISQTSGILIAYTTNRVQHNPNDYGDRM